MMGVGNTIKKWIIFSLIILVVLGLSGCSGSQTQAVNEETETTTTDKAYSSVAEERTIKLTANYSYTLPGGFSEIYEDFDKDALATNCFATEDKSRQIRSLVLEEDFAFPEDVEAYADGENAQVGYGGLYDTAIARITDSIVDGGKTIYRTLFIWPDGADRICLIELTSYDEEYTDFESEIRGSIRNRNAPSGTGTYGFYDEYSDTPTDEEIDNALAKDAQEAYEEYMNSIEESQKQAYPYY